MEPELDAHALLEAEVIVSGVLRQRFSVEAEYTRL